MDRLGRPRSDIHAFTLPGFATGDTTKSYATRLSQSLGVTFEEIDITAGPDAAELQRSYGEEIPVTFVDGRQHDFWRVDEARLRAALGG